MERDFPLRKKPARKWAERFHSISLRKHLHRSDEKKRIVDFSETAPVKTTFLVGTNSGLLCYDNGCFVRLFENPVYGIARCDTYYYILQRLGKSARIVRFLLQKTSDGFVADNITILVDGLCSGIHQIDVMGDQLFACDTYNNRILSIRLNGKMVEAIYPSGILSGNDITSINYRHYNSIYSDFEHIYLVAHNDSLKSGRSSEIHVFDFNSSWKFIQREKSIGFGAHNYLIRNDDAYWCDSLTGTLVKNREVVYKVEKRLTRGLASNDNLFIVGGSAWAFGKDRLSANGSIFLLDDSFDLVSRIDIKASGGISEIRLIGEDYGLSNIRRPVSVHGLSKS